MPFSYSLGVDEWVAKLRKIGDQWAKDAAGYFVATWGLDPTFAVRAGLLYLALYFAGLNPRITSGFRDPRKQQAMRDAWDRGDRAGLRVRPADPRNSLHCREVRRGVAASQAIDMPCSDEALAAQLATALGLRAGYYFKVSDPGHYDNGGL